MPSNPITEYLLQIQRELQSGNATEHTHRPALKTLLESLAPKVTATNEPKHVECGAPDFIVSRKASHGPVTVGYLEAKDVGKDLDEVEKSEQMKRYLHALPSLILTDYLEFRWYVDGEHRQTARLARVGKGGKLAPEKNGAEAVTDLLTAFLAREAEPINDPKTLALRMARLTHFIRDMIVTAFEGEAASSTLQDLHGAFEKALIPELPIAQFADMFAQTLAYGLFAARVNHHGPIGSFKRSGAASEIPKTNPFLRQLFETITGTALDEEPFVGFVDDLAQLLADTDIGAVLADFGKRTARHDPVVHFYETFLAAYDPKLRESRGVYYTPEPLVSYIVRSVDHLLKTRFGCANGLADTATVEYEREEENGGKAKTIKATSPRVLILDPACGTGTFLYAVVDHIRSEFTRQGNAGMWSGYVRNHLLPRIFGFELLMAPYAVAHFKLGMQLAGHDLTPAQRQKWGYDFSGKERLGVFLTNSLEEAEKVAQRELKFIERVIAEEANAAAEIKRDLPILAVIGNPPYSGHSANRSEIERLLKAGDTYTVVSGGPLPEQKVTKIKKAQREMKIREKTFIGRLIQEYYYVDGHTLGERNPKWLQNDYVKFIRWGQWRIERTGAGVLAFITDHSYLDSPTFKGMRQQLMQTFSEIYVLDLHGNSKKQETCPDGSEDKNVFDIQQGVAIGIFVKGGKKTEYGTVWHADLWGVRETDDKLGGKYPWLFEHDLANTPWKEIHPQSPLYLFKPQRNDLKAEYDLGWSITSVMLSNNMGITTGIDSFATNFAPDELRNRVMELAGKEEDSTLREKYRLEDTSSFSLSDARKWAKSEKASASVVPIAYRCFDSRFVIYSSSVLARTRGDICHHLIAGENQALITFRAIRKPPWVHVFVSNRIATKEYLSTLDNSYLFPLYLYPPERENTQQARLGVEATAWPAGKNGRMPNLNPEFVADLEKRIGLSFVSDGKGDLRNTFGPEDVFNYIYAVFHSPTYRTRYAEFLKSDFPRVPPTSDLKLFCSLCGLGAELVALHLLESPKLAKPIARFPVKGSNLVGKGFPKYVAPREPEPGTGKPLASGRVYMSKNDPQSGDKGQYFEGVPPEVWSFQIGGYQVCEKWLKDRRGRTLTYEDLEHYQRVVTAIKETIRLMAEIDAAIPKWPIE
jgi:hypothetical protein